MNRIGNIVGVVGTASVALLLALGAVAQTGTVRASKTMTNLKTAYIGETTACARYVAFAKVADKEGYRDTARLFRAASSAEAIHAANHRKALEALGVKEPDGGNYTAVPGTTRINLKEAVQGESYERDTMYPKMLKEAMTEQQLGAIRTLSYAKAAEGQHAALYSIALRSIGSSGAKSTVSRHYSICPVCGATFVGSTPDKCTACGTSKNTFESVK